VFEDGIQQDVSFFGASEVPLDLAILLDTSASMTGKMQIVQQAAGGFLATLRPSDRTMIVDIKDATKVLFPLGGDFTAARGAIMSTVPSGGTALYNGAYLTLKELAKQRRGNTEVRRQAIVVLSDGDDTASLVSYDDLMDLAKQSGVGIYTITLRSKYLVTAGRAAGAQLFLAVRVRHEGVGPGDRCALVLRRGRERADRHLFRDRRRARDAIRAGLLVEEPEDGRRVSPRDRADRRSALVPRLERAPGYMAARASRTSTN
jgi:hypothetical protein